MKLKEKVKAIVTNTIGYTIENEEYGWPPGCSSWIFQPERPKVDIKKEDKE